MKLRNKKTGDIIEFGEVSVGTYGDNGGHYPYEKFHTLTELNDEWEDVPEEPKSGYIIDPMEEDCVSADDSGYEESDVERAKELGIWFETKEETEKAVEKLKALKRMKKCGFRFCIVSEPLSPEAKEALLKVAKLSCLEQAKLMKGGKDERKNVSSNQWHYC